MFESAELAHDVDDATFAKQERSLRADLLDAQADLLADASFSVIVLVSGLASAGKGETVNVLNEWLDPRHVQNHAFGTPTAEERQRPTMWRYWRALPPKGKIGMHFSAWYADAIDARVFGGASKSDLTAGIDRIRRFERLLTDDGTLVVKLWFHLTKKAQKKRLSTLEADKSTRWRVTKDDWEAHERYDDYVRVAERVLRETSSGEAPWTVIDGSNANYRSLAAGKALLAALRGRIGEKAEKAEKIAKSGAKNDKSGEKKEAHLHATPVNDDAARILRDLPFKERLSKEKYALKIGKLQGKLARNARSPRMKKRSAVLVFEGMDAGGKGGAIRRVTQALDARQYEIIPIAAPTQEERAQHYLWRFWRHLPAHDRFTLFDRSWYGRVLVERVEGFCSKQAWSRAYAEINDFEDQLAAAGVVVVKFWLAVTKDEQLRRFEEREKTRFKRFKITPEDWRNRKKWDDYVVAAAEMIDRTSTSLAPWHVIEANDKHLARVRVIEKINEALEK